MFLWRESAIRGENGLGADLSVTLSFQTYTCFLIHKIKYCLIHKIVLLALETAPVFLLKAHNAPLICKKKKNIATVQLCLGRCLLIVSFRLLFV